MVCAAQPRRPGPPHLKTVPLPLYTRLTMRCNHSFFYLICRPLYAIEHVNHRMILQVGPNGLIILLLLTSHSFNYRTFYQICQSNYSFCILQASINVDSLYMSRTLRPRFDIFPVIMSKQDVLYKHIYTYFR